jgi:aminoglycoside phosphotransferase
VLELPDPLRALLESYTAQPVNIGKSRALVTRWTHPDRETVYLKCEPAADSELERERAVQDWLRARGTRVPQTVAFVRDGDLEWLLSTAVRGRDPTNTEPDDVERVVTALARGLQRLHSVPIDDCPFDRRLAVTVPEVSARVHAGLVDEDDFDPERLGISAEGLLEVLRSSLPEHEDLVFTHGDACLPNLILHDVLELGFVDLGRAGIADRYQDLALVARSMDSPLYPQFHGWSTVFLERYGVSPLDTAKLEFYRLLDEFF